MRTMYRSVAESIDDMFFGPSMLDIMIQRLSRQAAEFAGIVGSGAQDEELVANAVKSPDETLRNMPGDLKALGGESSTSTFTTPICDCVLSIFELDQKKNWLRRQAVLVILQQVLGGTIER
jgi:sorting nexin-25